MTSLFRSNSHKRTESGSRQSHQETMTRPKSPFGDLNFLPGRKTSKVVEPYARPSTAEPYYNNPLDYKSFRRNDMQNVDRDSVLYNLAQKPATRSRSSTGETVYVGLSVNTTYHKASAFCGTGFSQKPYEPFSPIDEEGPVSRPRKDSLFSPQSGNNSRESSPKRGTSPLRQQHMMPPAVIGRPKINRWKSLAGMFGKKSACTVSAPKGVVRTQSMFDLKSFTQPKATDTAHTRSESRATVKDNPLRSNPINASVLAFRKPASSSRPETPLPDWDLSTEMAMAEPAQVETVPVLDVEIPTSRLDRYSVMFEGIDLKRRESLRERRLSGGHTKAAAIKPLKLKTSDRTPRTPGRRARANSHARSSSQSSIKSARLSLFPSGNTNASTQSLHRRQLTPPRPATLRRTVTAPQEALSPLEPPPAIGRLSINTSNRPRSASKSSDRRPSTSDRRPSTSHSVDVLASASPADLSPITPTHEMDPAAVYLASRKAAPWEHRRMTKPITTINNPANNLAKVHSRSDSSGSEYSVDIPLAPGKNFTHSTIIEESEDAEDWQHRNAQVSVARSLSVTKASNATRTQQPRLVPVNPGLQPVVMHGHRRNVQSVSGVVESS